MRREPDKARAEREFEDVSLPGGCILCAGDLALRITASGAQTVCTACRWISRASVRREGKNVHIVHPGLVA